MFTYHLMSVFASRKTHILLVYLWLLCGTGVVLGDCLEMEHLLKTEPHLRAFTQQ